MFGKKKEEIKKEPDKPAEQKKHSGLISLVMISVLSLIFVVIAVLMLFVKQVTITYICYAVCGVAIIVGIFAIARYFVTKAYCDLNEYGFAEGVLLVSLGICGMIKVDALAGIFVTAVIVALLVSGVVKLQSALALRMMNDAIWFLVLIISAVIIVFSMIALLNPNLDKTYTWYVLLADGVLSLINIIYLYFRIKAFNKAEVKAKAKQESDIRDRIIQEQADADKKKAEERRLELEKKAEEDKALEKELDADDAKYGFNKGNSVPIADNAPTAETGDTVTDAAKTSDTAGQNGPEEES